MEYITYYNSPVGKITIAGEHENITGLWIEGQKYYASTLPNAEEKELPVFKIVKQWLDDYFKGKNSSINFSVNAEEKELPVFKIVKQWLDDYFKGKNSSINFSVAPKGSDFRRDVWNILTEIPYGELTTYGKIAKQLEKKYRGKRVSAQAVGGAVGHNPISIIIPCHRVVGSNGSLTGYAGGLDKKVMLLKLEGAPLEGLFVPKKGTAL